MFVKRLDISITLSFFLLHIMHQKVQPEEFSLLVTMPISICTAFFLRRSKKSLGLARGKKEKGLPLPLACFPRVACKE